MFETEDAIQKGADEIDMVLAIGKLKAGEIDYVREEIRQIHEVCKRQNRLLKVIIEIYPLLLYFPFSSYQLLFNRGRNHKSQ